MARGQQGDEVSAASFWASRRIDESRHLRGLIHASLDGGNHDDRDSFTRQERWQPPSMSQAQERARDRQSVLDQVYLVKILRTRSRVSSVS